MSSVPLTRDEVALWPAMGPMSIKRERVLALLDENDALKGVARSADEIYVSRAIVEKAHQILNAGPGSAGIARTLLLLREALGT